MNGFLLFAAAVIALVLWISLGWYLFCPRYFIAARLIVLALIIAGLHRGPGRWWYVKRTIGILTGHDEREDWREP